MIVIPNSRISLTDTGKLLADEQIDYSTAAEASVEHDDAGRRFQDLSDDRGFKPRGMAAHRFDQPIRRFGRNDRDQFAFVGEIKRIQSQNLAGASHRLAYRQRRFVDANSGPR